MTERPPASQATPAELAEKVQDGLTHLLIGRAESHAALAELVRRAAERDRLREALERIAAAAELSVAEETE